MHTDLSQLTTAAGKWESMAGEFKKLEGQYKRDVHGVSADGSWVGLSEAAFRAHFDATLRELQGAQKEANAIAALLRDAHTDFVDLRGKVKAARADAVKAGMRVSDHGVCHFDFSKVSAQEAYSIRHQPDLPEVERSWTERIQTAVKAVSDADAGVKIALNAVVLDTDWTDGTTNGFNRHAKDDVEEYEAENVLDIATKINSGQSVSVVELEEFQRAMRDNTRPGLDDPAFSRTFLNGLGAENTLKLANRLNDLAYHDDEKRKGAYLGLEKGLANSLENAMQDPKSAFYKNFRDQLKQAGVRSFDLKEAAERPNVISRDHGQQVRGYQSLVTLMQHGEGYSTPFLHDLADDIRSVEDKKRGGDPNIWDLHGDFSGKNGGWFANDPLDGLLGVMSKNPEAATSYVDPGADGKNDNLKYLLKDREWEFNDTPVWQGNHESGKDIEKEDSDARTGLGLLLESSTTGHPPLGPGQDPWPAIPHTEAQARIMHAVIGELGPSQTVHENMREPLARGLATYAADTHEMLANLDSKYITNADTGHFLDDQGELHLAVDQKSLTQFMRGLSDDPEAYGTLHKAESRYIGLSLEELPKDAPRDELTNRLDKSGAALGAFAAIKEDVINDKRMAGYSDADWKAKVAYHVIGGAVTPLYFTTAGGVSIAFGDSIQRGVDTWAWEWGNRMKGEVDTEANAKIADLFLEVDKELPILVSDWAEGRKDISETTTQTYTAIALNGRDRGTNAAAKYLTDTPN
ncbi:DUF6571 family protein [Streptomyces sp. TRM49041]|uniref:DUF6571 family protein n=1 Tax=Streptomyces sp. TRM49041 TaxID=2603216 RepID=UPI0021CD08CB|nr:DUF6571 family protein [Streptomyces sp. TRM49041]